MMGSPEMIDTDVDGAVDKANKYLTDYLDKGMQYSHMMLDSALWGLDNSGNLAKKEQKAGFEKSQGLNAPYRLAGYNALDSYLDTLTVARPEMGSYKLAQALSNSADRDAAYANLESAVRNQIQGNELELFRNSAGQSERIDAGKTGMFPTLGLTPEGQFNAGLYAVQAAGMDPGTYASNLKEEAWGPGQQSAYRRALEDYATATKDYTPEQYSIARSFNQGLLGDPRWKNVGGDNPLLGAPQAWVGG